MTPTDAELLERSDDDPEAFVAFYDRHERAVIAWVGSMVRDAELTLDAVAETFARAFESRGNYRELPGGGRAWLLGIARHVVIAGWRKGRMESTARERLQMGVLVITDERVREVERAVLESDESVVSSWLADLPVEQREAVRRRVLDEDDYSSIASDLDCSEAVVRKRVSRGLATLRRHSKEQL